MEEERLRIELRRHRRVVFLFSVVGTIGGGVDRSGGKESETPGFGNAGFSLPFLSIP